MSRLTSMILAEQSVFAVFRLSVIRIRPVFSLLRPARSFSRIWRSRITGYGHPRIPAQPNQAVHRGFDHPQQWRRRDRCSGDRRHRARQCALGEQRLRHRGATGNNVSISRSVFSGNYAAGVEGIRSRIVIIRPLRTRRCRGERLVGTAAEHNIGFNNTAFGSAGTFGNNRFSGYVTTGTALIRSVARRRHAASALHGLD